MEPARFQDVDLTRCVVNLLGRQAPVSGSPLSISKSNRAPPRRVPLLARHHVVRAHGPGLVAAPDPPRADCVPVRLLKSTSKPPAPEPHLATPTHGSLASATLPSVRVLEPRHPG